MQDEQNLKQVSHGKAAVLGFQHLLSMYSGDILVPLLVGAALQFNATQMTYLISTDIFMCGIATLLQLKRTPLTGVGLPVVLGCAVQYVAPLKSIGTQFGDGVMYGAIMAAGLFVFLIAGLFSKLKKFFPPVVTGSLIVIIGFSLIPVAVQNMGGGDVSSPSFGNGKYLFLGIVTMIVIVLINVFAKGFIRSISVLIGMVVGTGLAGTMGLISLKAVSQADWFHFPHPMFISAPKFEWSSTITLILVALTAMVETTGVFFALSEITGQKVDQKRLTNGYRSEGLAAILGGLFNTFPYSTFSENVGVVQLSGIKTKRPIYYSGFFLLVLGLLPKVAALALIMPDYVLGGAMIVMFGMVGIQGIKTLSKVDFNNNQNLLVAAVSIGSGLGVTIYPQIFNALPPTAKIILANGIVITSILAVGLNALFSLKNKSSSQKS